MMIALLVSWLAAAAPGPVPSAPSPSLRPAEAILADYAQAIGGRAAWKRLRSVHIKRSLTVAGQGVSGSEEHWATADGESLSESTLHGVGTFRQGRDRQVAWSQDPVYGLRKLDGAELEEARINGAWNAEPDLASLYAKVTSVPAPKDAEPGLECVELQKKLGKASRKVVGIRVQDGLVTELLQKVEPSMLCFDAKTHLRALQTGTQPSPGGDIPYRIVFGDWRTVKGVKTWYLEKMTAGPSTIEGRITSLAFDEKIPASKFRMPKP